MNAHLSNFPRFPDGTRLETVSTPRNEPRHGQQPEAVREQVRDVDEHEDRRVGPGAHTRMFSFHEIHSKYEILL